MDTPQDRVPIVSLEARRLSRYLQTLPPEAWRQPSACASWRVDDVVAHLAGGALSCAESIAHGLQRDVTLEAGYPLANVLQEAKSIARELRRDMTLKTQRPEAEIMDATTVAQRDAEIVIAARKRLGEQLLLTFEATEHYFQEILAGCGPMDWDTPCFYRTRTLPVRTVLDLRMTELAIHGWDIRSRLEEAAPLFAESVPVLLDRIETRFGTPGSGDFRLGSKQPVPVCYRFELTGTMTRAYDLIVENDRSHLVCAEAENPEVTFRCETDLFILMMYRRLSLDGALATSTLFMNGDQALTLAFDRWLQGD